MAPRRTADPPETVFGVLRRAADTDPDLLAYVEWVPAPVGGAGRATSGHRSGRTGRRTLSFGGWHAAAESVAAHFAELGVAAGDVVALLLPSSIDYAVAYGAALRLGAVTTGVNLRLGPAAKASILARIRPALTVAAPGDLTPDLQPLAGAVVERATLRALADSGPAAAGTAAAGRLALRAVPVDPAAPVAVVWTSGTTGEPKGALFDHRSLEAVAAGTDVLSARGDRRLNPLPFAHVGYMTRLWDEIAHRITSVVTPAPWSAAEAVAMLAAEKVTVAQGVPTQWALVLAHPSLDGADLSALRIAATGGAPASPELVRAMRERLGCPVVVRYTSTEASLGTGTVPGDPDVVVATTVGRPVPGVELALVSPEGAVVAPGKVGRVRLRSAAAMRGYVATRLSGPPTVDPVATAGALDADGWVTTGDLGALDDDGNLRLAGRATEMIVRGGYNVYPVEVEGALVERADVAHAAVFGLPDPVLGEVVCAVIVAAGPSAPTLGAVRDWVASRLADYKAPDRLVVLDALPLTAMGKVDKRRLAGDLAAHDAIPTVGT